MATRTRTEARRWVRQLLSRHIARVKIPDSPEADTAEFADVALSWDLAFAKIVATDAEADLASRATLRKPIPWWRDQLPAVLAEIEEERGANLAQGPGGADSDAYADRDAAAAASKSCTLCDGSGLAVVYHRDYAGNPVIEATNSDGTPARIRARFVLACVCPMGKWLLRANQRCALNGKLDEREREKIRAQSRRMEGIEAVLEGRWIDYTTDDPSPVADDAAAGPPRHEWQRRLGRLIEKARDDYATGVRR